ncbi:hypothetical protein G6F40_018160 [Rhizopus arrhizus]|nr:hypothetical protein G6F40_018160 [Rhizopus arrhizus]
MKQTASTTARSIVLMSSTNAATIRTACSSNSCRKAASPRKVAMKPSREWISVWKMRRRPVLPCGYLPLSLGGGGCMPVLP